MQFGGNSFILGQKAFAHHESHMHEKDFFIYLSEHNQKRAQMEVECKGA